MKEEINLLNQEFAELVMASGEDRDAKIKAIDKKIFAAESRITTINNKLNRIYNDYCEKYGHDFVKKDESSTLNSKDFGLRTVTYQCTICGKEEVICQRDDLTYLLRNRRYWNAYLREVLPEGEESLNNLLEKREKLIRYCTYLSNLKELIYGKAIIDGLEHNDNLYESLLYPVEKLFSRKKSKFSK